jgi:hypothetical protein
MSGDKTTGLWGWGDTARRMQTLLAQGGSDARDRYENRYYEARYNLTRCNLELGLAQTGAKKTEALETAKTQVVSFVAITSDFSDEWWPKFDGIYREIQTGLGMIPEPLEKPQEYVAPLVPEKIASNSDSSQKPKKGSKKAKVKSKDDGTLTYAIFGIIALLGVGGGGFMVMKGTKSRKPSAAMASVTIDAPVIAPPPAAPQRKKRPATAQKGGTAAPAAKGEKPRRPLTPEEKDKIRRRRAARAKAEEEAKKKADGE